MPMSGKIVLCIGLLLSFAQMQSVAEQNALTYQVFVRSFADSNSDGIGDLKGLVQKLDYLNDGKPETDEDLEVGIIWLMPIFPSDSYHGYDILDYRTIHADYGTLEDFKTLIEQADKRGIKIILDVAFNHTSNNHPWFQAASTDPNSRFRDYYHFRRAQGPAHGKWRQVPGQELHYLGLFSHKMPDLNIQNQTVQNEIQEIAKFWLDLGVAGFRLDAAKHVYGDTFDRIEEEDILRNNDFWLDFSRFCYRQNNQAILVGEVLGDRELLRRHSYGLDALLDEPFMEGLRAQVSHPRWNFLRDHKRFLDAARELNRKAYDPSSPFPDLPFQSFTFAASHDKSPRLASELELRELQGMKPTADQAYRIAMYYLLLGSSHPILYCGDEIKQRGWKWKGNQPTHPFEPGDGSGIFDETLREPFPWSKTATDPHQTTWFPPRFDHPNDGVSVEEQSVEGGMLHLIRGLTNLRSKHPRLAHGPIGKILNDSDEWTVFERGQGPDTYLVLINLTEQGHDYRFDRNWHPEYIGAKVVFWSDTHQRKWKDVTGQNQRIQLKVFVPPHGLVVLQKSVRDGR